jgi:hypothetical protein
MGGGSEEEAPRVIAVRIRRLRLDSDDHRALCANFDCGSEEWELQVSRFISRTIWLPNREAEFTLLGVEEEETGHLFGFGAWKHTTVELPQRDNPVPVIRICYFGVAEEFKGAVDADGRKWASRLYSTVEDNARKHPESTLDMPLELFCDRRNERGLRFWTSDRRGFVVIGPGYGELLRLVRMPPAEEQA